MAGTTHNYTDTARTASGGTIDSFEKQKKTDTQAIKTEDARRTRAYANRITQGGRIASGVASFAAAVSTLGLFRPKISISSSAANQEAASKIRAGTKLDSGTKTT